MKKLRIGILTFHRSINYGAVMQCYALQQKIQTDFPDDIVEVIDYIPQDRYNFYQPTLKNYLFSNWRFISSPPVRAKSTIGKITHLKNFAHIKKRFDVFQQSLDCLKMSKEFYCTDDPETFREEIRGKYDIIVVGSDCVWEWSILGIPSVYFLHGDFNAHKLSYAACSAVNDFRDLNSNQQDYLRQSFDSYDYIGVRDSATAFNAESLTTNKTIYRNCDPTTLIDPSTLEEHRQRMKERLSSKGIDWSRPVIGLMCNDIISQLAYDIFGDSVQYVGVYNPIRHANIFMEDLKVLEWASIFGLFSLTFTTFFHGTMLSLVNRTPVLSFDYYEGDETHLSKINELYKRLELPDYYHKGKRTYNKADVESIGHIAQRLLNTPQAELINKKIRIEAESYCSFREALEGLHH